MSRVTRGVEQHTARIIDTVGDTIQQRAEPLEVLTKTKQERFSETETSQQRAERLEVLRQNKTRFKIETGTNFNNEQSDSRC